MQIKMIAMKCDYGEGAQLKPMAITTSENATRVYESYCHGHYLLIAKRFI